MEGDRVHYKTVGLIRGHLQTEGLIRKKKISRQRSEYQIAKSITFNRITMIKLAH